MKNPLATVFARFRRPSPQLVPPYLLYPEPPRTTPALVASPGASLYKDLQQNSWREAAQRYALGQHDLRGQPRDAHRHRAVTHGYFWLPCPLCHEPFGGHEACGMLYDTASSGRMVCVNCIPRANELNALRGLTITEVPWHST